MSDHQSRQIAKQPSLRHLEQLMAQLLDGVILIDTAGTIISANTAALRMHGVSSPSQLGQTAEEYAQRFSLRDASHRVLKHREYPLFRLLAGETFPDLTVEVMPKGEEDVRWIHNVRDVTMDEDGGDPDCLALVISDVSEQFNAETRFNAMFQANPAPALIISMRDQRISQANPGFLELTRFNLDDVIGRTVFGLDLLGALEEPHKVKRQIEAGEVVQQAEAELLVKDGSRRLVLFAGQPIDVTEDDALLLTFADLEPRRLAEHALAASERHLSSIFEIAPSAMVLTQEPKHTVALVNAAFRALTGHDDDQAVGHTMDALQLWESADHHAFANDEVRKTGGFRNWDCRLRHSNGARIDCLVSAQTVGLKGTTFLLWAFHDISERRRSELELVDAIEAVMQDARWLSRSIIDKLATLRRPAPPTGHAELSAREREILELVCQDLDDAAIADRLSISRNTLRNHIARIYAKTGVSRRTGAVIWGRERGMGARSD